MATLTQRISDFVTRAATEFKAVRAVIGDLSTLTTTNKTSLVAATNEVKGLVAGITGGAVINDALGTTTVTWSASKISSEISTQVANLLGSSTPATLNTLDELAAAIGDDANFAATITTALGNRVRYDAAQSLTLAQKLQARTNVDAFGSVEIGDPDTNFVTVFTTGLA